MKKRKGISLIETLISLTIVGISMVALLPVVTIKKDGLDKSYGNKYWKYMSKDAVASSGTKNIDVYYPSNYDIITVGIDDVTATSVEPFYLYNRGFANAQVLPLRVVDKLNWNNMVFEHENNTGIRLGAGGIVDKGNQKYAYQRAVFALSVPEKKNIVAIENFHAESPYIGTYSYDPVTSFSGKRNSDEYYSVSNGDEYLVVDKTNQVIGIGRNAARFYSGKDFIAILDNQYINGLDASGNSKVSEMENYNGGLVIGRTAKHEDMRYVGYGQNDGFVIYRPKDKEFTINANLVADGGFKAGSVIIPSDKRLKDILYDYKKSVSEITKIKPVNFTYKNDKNKIQHTGVIAQDLKKIFPEAVSKNQTDEYLMITEDPVFYALLNAIKALDEKNNSLKKENDELEKKVMKLREIRDRLKASQGGSDEK